MYQKILEILKRWGLDASVEPHGLVLQRNATESITVQWQRPWNKPEESGYFIVYLGDSVPDEAKATDIVCVHRVRKEFDAAMLVLDLFEGRCPRRDKCH